MVFRGNRRRFLCLPVLRHCLLRHRRLDIVCVVVLFLFVPAYEVPAHASLVEVIPEQGSVLEESPTRMRFTFSEPVEPRAGEIRILDARGEPVDVGEPRVEPDDPTRITIDIVQQLERGTYTVAWWTLSAVDGHVVRGSFVFGLGESPGPGVGGAVTEQTESLPLSRVLYRWMTLLGVVVISGGFVFRPPGFGLGRTVDEVPERTLATIDTLWWSASALGMTLLGLGAIGQLIVHPARVSSPILPILLETSWGMIWILRAAAWVALGASLVLVPSRTDRTQRTQRDGGGKWALAVAGPAWALLVLSLVLTSHVGAGTEAGIPARINHYLHLTAAGLWAGALLFLALMIPFLLRGPSRSRLLKSLLTRFRIIMLPCAVILILTGVLGSWVQVTVHDAMNTPYGRILAIKVLLSVPLFFLDVILYHGFVHGVGTTAKTIGRLVTGEVLLAVLVLISVSFLAFTEPARLAADRLGLLAPDGPSHTELVDGTEVTVSIDPGTVGSNRMVLDLADRSGEPITDANILAQVYVYPTHAIHLDERPTPVAEGRYVVEDISLSVEGIWETIVLVQRPDAFDTRASFRFPVIPATPAGIGTVQPGSVVAWRYLAAILVTGALLIAGVVVAAWGQPRARAKKKDSEVANAS